MTAFYVGQRVRLVRPFHSQNMGATGTIREMFHERKTDNAVADCLVEFDRPVIGDFTHTSQLEPLTPPNIPAESDWIEQFDSQFSEVFGPVKA